MDVIYLLRASRTDEELRYSLRSLEMYVGGVDRVFIFGHCPAWLDVDQVWHYGWDGPMRRGWE